MAWRCSAADNAGLVRNLQHAGLLCDPASVEAMLRTDRAHFVPPLDPSARVSSTYAYGPYADSPQPLGHKVTISAPHMHAVALDALSERIRAPASRVLDVGSGSGVLLACMARMAPADATIVGVEIVAELVALSLANLRASGLRPNEPSPAADGPAAAEPAVLVRHADGWSGAADLGPFDAIHVGAFAPAVPALLAEQLAPGGRMLVPLGEATRQSLVAVDRRADGSLVETALRRCRFVPLRRVPRVDAPAGAAERAPAPTTATDAPPQPPGGKTALTIDWDARYRRGWAYGKQPNEFLAAWAAEHLGAAVPCGGHVLCVGEGQGRNAVHLARLGHAITAVDQSAVGLDKAARWAEASGVPAERFVTVVADLTDYAPEPASVDGVASIFVALPAAVRARLHSACVAALRPGGLVVIECFAPAQAALRGARAAGPPAEMLVGADELQADFAGLEVIACREVRRQLDEGRFHRGCNLGSISAPARPPVSARPDTQPAARQDGGPNTICRAQTARRRPVALARLN